MLAQTRVYPKDKPGRIEKKIFYRVELCMTHRIVLFTGKDK